MAAGRHLGFDGTGNGAVRSAVPINPTLETNTESIGRRVTEIWPFEVLKMAAGRHLEFDPTGNGAVRSAVLENPTLEPNMKEIGSRVAELWPFEIFLYL